MAYYPQQEESAEAARFNQNDCRNTWRFNTPYFSPMSSTFYLPRRLSSNDRTYTEEALLTASNYVVVLAEPGGGKTELMGSLAQQLGTSAVTANVFRHVGANVENCPLVIDAFDELAKVDQTGIHGLLANARRANPTHVIISSRSSEWDSAATNAFKDFLGQPPLVVRLFDFDEAEQRAIFDHHVPSEDFAAFQAEVARFDLETLLPNPQFLKLFADAYIESERQFTDKRSIFAQAVERLAREANINVARTNPTLSTTQKVDLSSEAFAKLLLSGAEGVGTSEATEDRLYPLLASLFSGNTGVDGILATRLFKPGDSSDQHRPIHKIVAEYCAAAYLTKRIADPADPLTLPKCLPIIAPNSTVRDELRGLLGWMAALGNKPIEEAAIELDPYAVLANGDPSQLEHSSKRLLVKRLKEIEARDPYFRRGDFWRRFSVAGFFTQDVVKEIKPLLVTGSDGHLRDLILELLAGSPAIEPLRDELRQLTLTPNESENTRLLASRCLLHIGGHDHRADLAVLVSEASQTSLKVAAKIIETLCPETFDRAYLADFLRVCTNLYPSHQEHRERTIGARYFVKRFIDALDLAPIEWLLDELTKELSCKCGKESYECDCRNGMSKIIGLMLDRYFELATPPFDPKRVWQWVGNLNFHEQKVASQSKAVQVLQQDDGLRQGIIAHVFGKLTDRDQIFEIKIHKFDLNSHSGLRFHTDDHRFVVDLAFETDNSDLWTSFIARNQYHRNKGERGADSLRRHMREQALKNPSFMREWVKSNRAAAKFEREHRMPSFRHTRRMKRRHKLQDDIRAANSKYVQDNRELVESGRHWRCLVRFADLVLMHPDKIEREFGDETLVRNALRNCLDFIAPHVPDLLKLAELQCASQGVHSETILYAACLEIMRVKGNLEEVDLRLLKALRTNIHMGYSAVSNEDRDALKSEVDRLVFPNIANAEDFLRQYVEPQLVQPECMHPEVWLLSSEDVFSHSRATLSIEWLRGFRGLALGPLDTLFEIAAQYGNREDLKEVIAKRCAEFMSEWPNATGNGDIEQKRTFWFVRAWYFLNDPPATYWNWLRADKDTVHLLYERSGRMVRSDRPHWPRLTPRKVESILEAFIDKWPKVDLPSHWGTGSPKEESAYRFLTEVIWSIDSDDSDEAIPVLDRLLTDPRFVDLHKDLKSIHAGQVRKKALRDFEPPTPREIVNRLDRDAVVTVEGLRELVIQELQDFQRAIAGGEYNSANRFYEKSERLDEEPCTEIIAERLSLRLQPQNITVTPEHHLKAAKRSDFTVAKSIGGKRRLLVTEVKGQWHRELYTAASAQLYERYSIHPDAEHQGIFLAIWFGADEEVAGRKNHGIGSAQELKSNIETTLPPELTGLIDVFVLDVSKPK
ncbi:ATP-binding protein [Cupriavidus necator]